MFKKALTITASILMLTNSFFVFCGAAETEVLKDNTQQETVQTVERNLTISPDSVIREYIHPQLYGYNFESYGIEPQNYERATGAKFLADVYNKPNPEAVKALEGYPFVHIRYGGTGANYTRWKESLGNLWEKEIVDKDNNRYVGFGRNKSSKGDKLVVRGDDVANVEKNANGVIENLRVMRAFNPDMTVSYTLNVLTDTIENQMDLVEFLASDGSVNYNGGENWGKIRKEKYKMEKVNLFAWELGNEVDLSTTSIDEYIELINKYVPAIRSIDKTTPISVHIASDDTSSTGVEWQRRLLIECGDMIDYIVIHKYFTFNQVTAVAESSVRKLIRDINEFGDPERHRILFTEYNTGWITNRTDWKKNTSISSAVTIADYFVRMLHYPQLIEADFEAINSGGAQLLANGTGKDPNGYTSQGGPWWAYYTDIDQVVKPVAPVDVMKVFCDYSKNAKVITTDLEGFELGNGAMATCVGLKQQDGDICVCITNFEEFKDLKINLQNSGYYLKEDIKIYGTNGKYSMNHFGVKEVNIDKKSYDTKDELKSYTLVPMSFAMIRLSPIN